jgi:uncharacterized OB-fold protein
MVSEYDKYEALEPIVFDGKLDIPSTYPAGKVGSKFLIGLRDEKKIMGIKCPECDKVFVPPKSICKYCYGQLSELVEVGKKGTLVTYAVVRKPNMIQTAELPIIYGIVKLEGAYTGFTHMLGEVDPEQLKVGMEVEAVFKAKEDREASILDIKYFKPLG